MSVIAGSLPSVIDCCLDYLSLSHMHSIHNFEIKFRLKISLLLMISDLVLLILAPSHMFLIPCIFKSRESLFFYVVLSYLSSNFPSIIAEIPAKVISYTVLVVCTVDSFVAFSDPAAAVVTVAQVVVIILKVAITLYLLWTFFIHYRRYLIHNESFDMFEPTYLMARMTMTLFTLLVLSMWILNIATGWRSWQENGPTFFIAYACLVFLFSTGLTLTYWRIISEEAAQFKVRK